MKVLFLIHDLGQGGAEKVLVNLVNNMNSTKFDITVVSLFGGGINEQFLSSNIRYYSVFQKAIPGNSKIMKLFSPRILHKICVRERYDIEVSYLEGPSARIISGCRNQTTKLVSWIHVEQHTIKKLSSAFRNKKEAKKCYEQFDQTICVSENVKQDFCKLLQFKRTCQVLYNTVESDKILKLSKEIAEEIIKDDKKNLIAVGTLKESKGYLRMLNILKKLKKENYKFRLYILGIGPQQKIIENYIRDSNLDDTVILLGYHTNPYKYISKCDLFVCASYAEGFSTAVTEALIVGTPVCTVEVSGMKELLGSKNEYGIVTENSEKALYNGIKGLLDNDTKLSFYRKKAKIRGQMFCTEKTIQAVEDMFYKLMEEKNEKFTL